MSRQLNEFRLQVERLDYDNKESGITIELLKEQNQDATNELEELRKSIAELKINYQREISAEEKEKKKQEKMALMMAELEAVSVTNFYVQCKCSV